MDLIRLALAVATNPKYGALVAPLVWFADAALSLLIVKKIPYTEIDWVAYMEQVQLIRDGETDYARIEGGTGPLVYPGGHVRIFSLLYNLTDNGTSIDKAQLFFLGLYLTTLAVVLTIYVRVKVPPFLLPFLMLSKRLHSIYLLRLFNDCFSVLFAAIAVLIITLRPTKRTPYLKATLAASALFFSLAVSVKMSALLFLPGAAIVYLQDLGSVWQCIHVLFVPFVAPQVILALPFAKDYPQSYLSRAFEFSRQFLYKWTVNWRFIPEEIFLSKELAGSLLALHLTLLGILVYRRVGLGDLVRSFYQKISPSAMPTPRSAVNTILTANLIGILCARSLHYQFYCWFYWTIPLLLHTSSLPIAAYPVIWAAQEWAWNVFPSTTISSATVIGTLAITVFTNL